MSIWSELTTLNYREKAAIVSIQDKARKTLEHDAFEDVLHTIAFEARMNIGAHQSAISYIPDGDFKKAVHTHAFSDKYAKYNKYDVMPTGEGIWSVIVRRNISMRMTDTELKSHPAWNNFSNLKDSRGLEHPPMVGWLAVPVRKKDQSFIGVIQLSDKIDGDFDDLDEEMLWRFARTVGPIFEMKYQLKQQGGT